MLPRHLRRRRRETTFPLPLRRRSPIGAGACRRRRDSDWARLGRVSEPGPPRPAPSRHPEIPAPRGALPLVNYVICVAEYFPRRPARLRREVLIAERSRRPVRRSRGHANLVRSRSAPSPPERDGNAVCAVRLHDTAVGRSLSSRPVTGAAFPKSSPMPTSRSRDPDAFSDIPPRRRAPRGSRFRSSPAVWRPRYTGRVAGQHGAHPARPRLRHRAARRGRLLFDRLPPWRSFRRASCVGYDTCTPDQRARARAVVVTKLRPTGPHRVRSAEPRSRPAATSDGPGVHQADGLRAGPGSPMGRSGSRPGLCALCARSASLLRPHRQGAIRPRRVRRHRGPSRRAGRKDAPPPALPDSSARHWRPTSIRWSRSPGRGRRPHLISRDFLRRSAPQAFGIYVGPGTVVDEKALVAAYERARFCRPVSTSRGGAARAEWPDRPRRGGAAAAFRLRLGPMEAMGRLVVDISCPWF